MEGECDCCEYYRGEIERLKRAISEAMSDFQRYVDANEALIEAKAEIERLRAMLLERGRAHGEQAKGPVGPPEGWTPDRSRSDNSAE